MILPLKDLQESLNLKTACSLPSFTCLCHGFDAII